MRRPPLTFSEFPRSLRVAAFVLCLLARDVVAAPPASSVVGESGEAKRMAWWREARFGLFIHWGVYAVPAGSHRGKAVNFYSEWLMHKARVPVAEYRPYAKEFNPLGYDPEAWVLAAKNAGMRYIVITTKHHDGFALFETKASDWNVVEATPYAKDLIRPLAEACRRHGIKLGFYYSQAQDWVNGGATDWGNGTAEWDPAQKRDFDDYLDRLVLPQLTELLTAYGEAPALIWWDTPTHITPARAKKINDHVQSLRPGIIMNNRLGGDIRGDTETPEQTVPPQGYPGRDWETCMTMNGSWGYRAGDEKWKSATTLIRHLSDIASKGGNFLLNVGPTAQGEFPAPCLDRLADIGAWMRVNGEAIHATLASPFPRAFAWGRATRKPAEDGRGETLFLHVWDWEAAREGVLLPGIHTLPDKAGVLATGQALALSTSHAGLVVSVTGAAPDPHVSILSLKFSAPLRHDRPAL